MVVGVAPGPDVPFVDGEGAEDGVSAAGGPTYDNRSGMGFSPGGIAAHLAAWRLAVHMASEAGLAVPFENVLDAEDDEDDEDERVRVRQHPRAAVAADVESLTAAIRRGLDDADLRTRVGAAGRQRVVERWSWKHCAQLTVDQYREVLAMPQNIAKLRANGLEPLQGSRQDFADKLRAESVYMKDFLAKVKVDFSS